MFMKANKLQKQYIYKLCGYRKDLKEEYVQWATNDNNKISTNDLTFEQANKIIKQLKGSMIKYDNWAYFDKNNQQHKYIISLLYQIGWTTGSERYGRIADLERFSEFLKSEKSPVRKKLKSMQTNELSKIINALESMLDKRWKKNR